MAFDPDDDAAVARERLSALVDGELDVDAVATACARWREDGNVRSTWHAYHVIGDVLRSEDLALDPARDASFLATLSVRLQREPVVLAPRTLAVRDEAPQHAANGARHPRRWVWIAPMAVAAGFVAVVGVTQLTRSPVAGPERASGFGLAQVAPVAQPLKAAATLSVGAPDASSATVPATAASLIDSEPQPLVATGKIIRDARLDRYLAAHKQFAGSSALGVPSGFLRNATAIEADR